MDWGCLVISCFLTYFPFEVFGLCYRFDYFRAKARGEVLTSSAGVELGETRKVNIRSLFDVQLPQGIEGYYGIRLPPLRSSAVFSTADPKFPKPYYHTAWFGLALSALLVLSLASGATGLKFRLESFDVAGLYIMPFTLPLTYILVLLRAAARGEVRLLWDYKERWQSSSNQIRVDGSDPLKDDVSGKDIEVTVPTISSSYSNDTHDGILEDVKIVTYLS